MLVIIWHVGDAGTHHGLTLLGFKGRDSTLIRHIPNRLRRYTPSAGQAENVCFYSECLWIYQITEARVIAVYVYLLHLFEIKGLQEERTSFIKMCRFEILNICLAKMLS